MRNLIGMILFLSSLVGFGQELVEKENRISIGVNFSPNYSFRTLKYSDELNFSFESRDDFEEASFGFNTGVQIMYKLKSKLELESGAQFSRQTHKFVNVPIIGGENHSEYMGTADSQNQYHYLEIPLKMNYRFIDRKFFVHATLGMSVNIFIDSRTKNWFEYNDGSSEVVFGEPAIFNENKIIFATMGGIMAGYNLNEKWSLRIEPLFRYSLTPIANAPIEQFNYSIGGQIGLVMNL